MTEENWEALNSTYWQCFGEIYENCRALRCSENIRDEISDCPQWQINRTALRRFKTVSCLRCVRERKRRIRRNLFAESAIRTT